MMARFDISRTILPRRHSADDERGAADAYTRIGPSPLRCVGPETLPVIPAICGPKCPRGCAETCRAPARGVTHGRLPPRCNLRLHERTSEPERAEEVGRGGTNQPVFSRGMNR